ncbi:MAG: hypothetical protein GX958_10660 [Desulfitobacterium sp.]|nr:hypothetical protein [Desulfitobacterium sp.]
MKSILYSEVDSEFLIHGLGLHEEKGIFSGKIGRYEIELSTSFDSLKGIEDNALIVYIGVAEAGPYREGDILMVGSDELLDSTFRAMDEMEQRGVVVSLGDEEDNHQVHLHKEDLYEMTLAWKEKKVPYLCLFMGEPIDAEAQAKLVTIARKVLSE